MTLLFELPLNPPSNSDFRKLEVSEVSTSVAATVTFSFLPIIKDRISAVPSEQHLFLNV